VTLRAETPELFGRQQCFAGVAAMFCRSSSNVLQEYLPARREFFSMAGRPPFLSVTFMEEDTEAG